MDRRAILEEIHKYAEPPTLDEDEVTVTQYAEFANVTHRQAEGALKRMMREGKAERRKVVFEAHRCWAYRLTVE